MLLLLLVIFVDNDSGKDDDRESSLDHDDVSDDITRFEDEELDIVDRSVEAVASSILVLVLRSDDDDRGSFFSSNATAITVAEVNVNHALSNSDTHNDDTATQPMRTICT